MARSSPPPAAPVVIQQRPLPPAATRPTPAPRPLPPVPEPPELPEPARLARQAIVRAVGRGTSPFRNSPSQRSGVRATATGGALSPARTSRRNLIGGSV